MARDAKPGKAIDNIKIAGELGRFAGRVTEIRKELLAKGIAPSDLQSRLRDASEALADCTNYIENLYDY